MSTLQSILDVEYTSWVDTQAVTCTIFATSGRPGPGTNVSITTASQLNEYQARRIFADFSHDANTKVWIIPDALLNPSNNGNVLKNGDVIADANGVKWRIDKVSRLKINTQWVCASTKQL